MNDNFSSLVFFTVICQTAVGALIFRVLTLLRSNETATYNPERAAIIAIIFMLIISLGIAFTHLGKPFHAINAFNNLRKSWLSREIFSLSFLIASLLFSLLLTTRSASSRRELIFLTVSLMAGTYLIYSMIRLYMIPSVISWNNPFTPVSFIITTFLCGISFMAVINFKADIGFSSFAIPLISVFLISSIINSLLFPGTFVNQNLTLFIIRTVLSFLSLTIAAVFFLSPSSNKIFILWVIMFIMIFSSEIINRYIFFLSFEKSGL
jgi:DMSO reductase anchor subunit